VVCMPHMSKNVKRMGVGLLGVLLRSVRDWLFSLSHLHLFKPFSHTA